MGNLSPRPEKARAAAADSAFRITALCQLGECNQFVSEIAAWEHSECVTRRRNALLLVPMCRWFDSVPGTKDLFLYRFGRNIDTRNG
jgi:hypothetical protein